MTPSENTLKKLPQLLSLLEDAGTLLMALQDNPDPDAIASAAALRTLANQSGVQCSIAHGGIVGRAENRALVKYMGVRLHDLRKIDVGQFDLIAMLDTQPGTGNNSLPPDTIPDIVIDHHPVHRMAKSVSYTDIRSRYGATATIIYEYLVAANVVPDPNLATALLYAIKSDTHELGRNARHRDIDAYLDLYPLANKRALGRIQIGLVPQNYFRMLARALGNASLFDKAVITNLGDVDNPDMIAEMADLLLRNEESTWALCYGFFDNKALFSLRSLEPTASAGEVARKLAGNNGTGGGHNVFAGGQIPLKTASAEEEEKIATQLTHRFLKALKITDSAGRNLV